MQLRVSEEDKSLWEARESALEQKIQDNTEQILKLESYWMEAQELCKSVNEQLAETQAQYETLDKKYNKAKKLLKDYQQKWVVGLSCSYQKLDITSTHFSAVMLLFLMTYQEYLDRNSSYSVLKYAE